MANNDKSAATFAVGDLVYWTDPDDNIASGWAEIRSIKGDVIVIEKDGGGEAEVFDRELSYTKPKRWKVDAGNSNTGQSGFVVYDLWADTAEAALAKIREELPNCFENHTYARGEKGLTVVSYYNAENLTLDNIEEDPEDDEDEDDE